MPLLRQGEAFSWSTQEEEGWKMSPSRKGAERGGACTRASARQPPPPHLQQATPTQNERALAPHAGSAPVGRVEEQSRARRQARRQWWDIGTLRRDPASRSASTRPSGRNLSSTADPQTCPAPSLVSHNKRQPVDLPTPGSRDFRISILNQNQNQFYFRVDVKTL